MWRKNVSNFFKTKQCSCVSGKVSPEPLPQLYGILISLISRPDLQKGANVLMRIAADETSLQFAYWPHGIYSLKLEQLKVIYIWPNFGWHRNKNRRIWPLK